MTLRTAILLPIIALGLSQCSFGQGEQEMHKNTNELIEESSPYLLQHAHNPVDWHAWNTDNLKEAEKLGKPLIISIGYSSCHWCHVMEHESFEDEEVADYMNKNFYCIKVDREERPDVDQVYMTAANIITGRGGWPLNCFALPNGQPFHAGTYYPKKDWLNLMKNVIRQYQGNLDKLTAYANKLTEGIRMQETSISDNPESALDPNIIEQMVANWRSSWDMELGGRKGAPKFPMPSNLEFLLHQSYYFHAPETTEFTETSLLAMALGGIYDQVGGGFARYSTDPYWKVPHFEKMLYDNAQLLKVYSMAQQRDEKAIYRRIVNETINWLTSEMRDESGLFYSALDADSEGIEGKYYVWSEQELKEVLGDKFERAELIFKLNEEGLWEDKHYILMQRAPLAELATKEGIDIKELSSDLEQIKEKLFKMRSKRIRPGLDDKCLSSWNGLLLSGLVAAYKAEPSKEVLKTSLELAQALKGQIYEDGKIWHSFKDGRKSIDGLLEDYAFVGLALLEIYSITGDEQWYTISLELCTKAHELFWDSSKGLYYMHLENELIVRTTEVHDNVIPSSNAAMNELIYLHGLLAGNSAFLEASRSLISKVQSNFINYPSGHSFWALNHLAQTNDFYEIAVIGKDARKVARIIDEANLLNSVLVFSERNSNLPIFADRYQETKTLIYVCKKGVCDLPSEDLQAVIQQIKPK